ncbi:MAG: DUF1294 domain-containing protein [Candidatus Magasanikbacteria bacterium]|nr:DUF1294 domain-containing protein [Candidatus Magasanikbacteria bacterium]
MFTFFLDLSLENQIFLLYLLGMNALSFFYFGIDKIKSRFKNRRISEVTLWLLSLFGGSAGAVLGMYFFRHKTKKLSFQAGMACILTVQILIAIFLLQNKP